jgi:hypothetical protein
MISSVGGGTLHYRSADSDNLASTHKSMATVVDILSDFHYTQLSAQVTLEPTGKLLLGFTLNGQNPSVQNARPIHLNVNIEEHLPTLLRSLQITNQVNEVIQKRIEQNLLKQRTSALP